MATRMSGRSPGRHAAEPAGGKGTRVLEAFDRLRGMILDLTLPPGALLDENEQVERLQLSRTPIHEAFVRLAAEGLLVMRPNRQAMVAPLDLGDLPRYIEALDLAHRAVVHLAARRRTAEDLAGMAVAARDFASAIRTDDALVMTEANRVFHATVASACHNHYLFAQYDKLLTLGLRMLRSPHVYRSISRGDLRRQVQEHAGIIAAIEAGGAEEAERLACAHTQTFVDSYVRSLHDNLTPGIAIEPSPTWGGGSAGPAPPRTAKV